MGKYHEMVQQAQKALAIYFQEEFVEILDQVQMQKSSFYSDSDLVSKLKGSTEQSIANLGGAGNQQNFRIFLDTLNKNPLLDMFLGTAGESVLSHQKEINDFFEGYQADNKRSLYDLGYGDGFFLRGVNLSQNNGLVGRAGGLSCMLDKAMSDLPEIVNAFTDNSVKSKLGLALASSMGFSPEKLREVYVENGFRGTGGLLDYTFNSLNDNPQLRAIIDAGKIKLEKILEDKGFEINLSEFDLEEFITKKKIQGLGGEKGAFNYALTNILGNYKNFGGDFYGVYVSRFLKEDREKTLEVLKKQGFVSEPSAKEVLQGIMKTLSYYDFLSPETKEKRERLEKKISNLKVTSGGDIKKFAREKAPACLQDNNLLSYIRDNGFIGENGFFDYMGEAMPQILHPFNQGGLISEEEINDIQRRYFEMSKITDFVEVILAKDDLIIQTMKPKKEQKGNAFIQLSQRAQDLGTTPYDFLRNPEFKEEKEKYLSDYWVDSSTLKGLVKITNFLENIVSSPDLSKELGEKLRIKKDPLGISDSIDSYLNLKKQRNPEYFKKISDYLRLARDIGQGIVRKAGN